MSLSAKGFCKAKTELHGIARTAFSILFKIGEDNYIQSPKVVYDYGKTTLLH